MRGPQSVSVERIENIERLEELLSEPTEAAVEALARQVVRCS